MKKDKALKRLRRALGKRDRVSRRIAKEIMEWEALSKVSAALRGAPPSGHLSAFERVLGARVMGLRKVI